MFVTASWKSGRMEPRYNMDTIKRVLREATTGDGSISQRKLSAAAGEGRDCVGDILNGRNKNPTIKVLTNLASALGRDVSIFGVMPARTDPPSADELAQALADHLPAAMRMKPEKRVRFLAAAVADSLGLPPALPSSPANTGSIGAGDGEEAAPPQKPTT